jgi:hypothetical protein
MRIVWRNMEPSRFVEPIAGVHAASGHARRAAAPPVRYAMLNRADCETPGTSNMSDKPIHKGPHDLGGTAAGPIDTTDHGMKFWERQANALRNTLTRRNVVRVDELRRAAEDLGDLYYKLAYFERTTMALRTLLIEKSLITEAELKARMAEVRARFDAPAATPSPAKKGMGR